MSELLPWDSTDDHKRRFLAALASHGQPIRAVRESGVAKGTAYHWRSTDETFARDWERAVDAYNARVLDELDHHIFKERDFKAVKFYLENQMRADFSREGNLGSDALPTALAVPDPIPLEDLPLGTVIETEGHIIHEKPA